MKVTDLKLANLQSLRRLYWNEQTEAAVEYLRTATISSQAVVLDSHLLRTPSQRAVKIRDAVDQLLQYFSIIELGMLAGALDIRATLPGAQLLLSMPLLVRYYQRFYPMALPSLHLARLQGQPLTIEGDMQGAQLLQEFVAINMKAQTAEVDLFLWFLDDGYQGAFGLQDVLRLLTDGEAFVQAMLTPTNKREPHHVALHGLLQFLSFSSRLNEFLISGGLPPLLRSAFWHFHGYWFQQIGGQVLGVMTAGVEALRTFAAPPDPPLIGGDRAPDPARDIEATHESMNKSIRDLQLLTSAVYRYPLDRHLLVEEEVPIPARAKRYMFEDFIGRAEGSNEASSG